MARESVDVGERIVAGRPVRVLRAGAGPRVVLVHGLGLGGDVWRYHVERLAAEGYEVIAPDMPGFGRSPGPALGYTVENAAFWLAEFARAEGIADAVWVGHSISTQYVLRLAVTQRDLVRGAVLAAPTGEPGHARWLLQLVGLARTSVREPSHLIANVLAHYLTTQPLRTIGSWLAARRHDALADAPLLHCPLRVVLGGRDPIVPRAFVERLVAHAPHADLVVLPESAHGVALAPAEPFCATLLDFLSSRFPRSAVDKSRTQRGKAVETP